MTRRMFLQIKALVPLVCLFSMVCDSTIFSFGNICCLYLILDLIKVAAQLFGMKLPLLISLTLSELVDASIESEQDMFWQEYQGLATDVTNALENKADQISAQCLPLCVEMLEKTHRGRLTRLITLLRSLRANKCFECMICGCWKAKSERVQCTHWSPWKHQHGCCRDCLRTWASEPGQIQQIIQNLSLVVPCFFVEGNVRCSGKFSEESLLKLGTCAHIGRIQCACSSIVKLGRDFKRRRFFVQNAGWKRYLLGDIVECPQANCVGCGYGETGVAMCFLCEHQWKLKPALSSLSRSRSQSELPPGCKRCPSCQVLIEKNGGCDHMSCRCGYQFWWSSGLKYRASH
mmetsp:Transcript_71478/g.157879  ORF Transcript_71478/g.157879 Transcript_71478/m.157879 type:complete len:346 (-) Transcript_71478:122-1159(-)